MTTTKDIVPNITANPQMIALVGMTFVATAKHNVARMSKQIADLQNKIYTYEQRATMLE